VCAPLAGGLPAMACSVRRAVAIGAVPGPWPKLTTGTPGPLLPLYDPFTRLAGIERSHEQLLDRADLRTGQRVLEVGCGTGNLLTALGRRRLGLEAVGIDPDPAALSRARRKAARGKLPIRYDRAFAGELPLPDDAFDRVLSALMLHHLDETRGCGRCGRSSGCCAPEGSCT
jgi:2-polyprenyl-3-methyl-5-hydroxy-6-metoxy-1,4-benzoquinol methylase